MNTIISNYNQDNNNLNLLSELKNFNFVINNIGFKKDRKSNDPAISNIMTTLKEIPSISNKEILYDEKFVEYFYNIVWDLIQKLGIATQNFYLFVPDIVNELNRITMDNYVLYDCHSTDNYNCGRAMIIIDKYPSKLLIFNTDETGHMDVNTQLLYTLPCSKTNHGQEININDINNYFPQYGNRIKKEINTITILRKVKLYILNDKLKIILPEANIVLTLDRNYPFSSPSGTYKDMTISEIDLDWSETNTLIGIINKLLNKNVPKHIEFLCYLLDF